MGWWSTDILGGDTPVEHLFYIKNCIECKLDLYPLELSGGEDYDEEVRYNLNNLVIPLPEDDPEYFPITLAAARMVFGAEFSLEEREEAIQACQKEDLSEWGDPAERKAVLDGFIELVKNYKEGEPIKIHHEGLFEKMDRVLIEEKK